MLTDKDYMQKISITNCLCLFDSKAIDFLFSLIMAGMKIYNALNFNNFYQYVEIIIIFNNLGAEEIWRNKNCSGL